jgi:hypothetical protein
VGSTRNLQRVICPVLEPLEEGRSMVRATVLQGVREMRFEALLDRHERGRGAGSAGGGRDAGDWGADLPALA